MAGAKPFSWDQGSTSLLGTMTDAALAERLGITQPEVTRHRYACGIKAFAGSHWSEKDNALLGSMGDAELARRLGLPSHVVHYQRTVRGIPAWDKRTAWTPEMDALLGTSTDAAVAQQLGLSRPAVLLRRTRLGIAAQPRASGFPVSVPEPPKRVRRARGLPATGFQPAGTEAAAALFAEAVARTGLLTHQDVLKQAGVSYKTATKHRKAGLLKGERRLVFGKLIWMYEPAEVARYAEIAAKIAAESRMNGRIRGSSAKATAPEGYFTVANLARESGRTAWCVYDSIERGELVGKPTGRKGAYLIAESDARRWIADYRYLPLEDGTATISAAAQACGVNENTLRAAIRNGRIRAMAFGDARTQAAPDAQVGRAGMRVRLADVREFAKRLASRTP